MISFFVRLPYIFINYMEARTLDYDIRKAVNLGQCKIDDFEQFGHRIQYSVFEIDNSKRIVDNIVNDLTNTFEKRFSQSDSVYIFKMSSSCEVLRYGYAKNEENDFFIIT
nr:CRISPR-associated endonuclease Cas2 [uncultured Agathobacter sp.]